nr:ribonuclease domain-containing protein [uncultured Schaedlerella sp.]
MNRVLMKHMRMRKWLQYFLVFLLAFMLTGCGSVGKADNGTAIADKAVGEIVASDEVSDGETADAAAEETGDIPVQSNSDAEEISDAPAQSTSDEDSELPEDGSYTSRDEVALYISIYGHLPSNFITKKEAQALGWEGGSLEPYAPGKCIGGSRFGNYEGLLPEKEGRVYTECDIDTLGADRRGAKRIVFSNDGLIYYTEDHYESFELLYGEE